MKHHNVNGIALAVSDSGKGRPVILVHGFPFDHSMWDALTVELTAKSTTPDGAGQYRIIAPDLRGFGGSKGPTAPGSTVTMEQHADDLASLLYSLQIADKIALCGLSMGGYVAMAFARKYAAKLSSLILCDTRAGSDPPEIAGNRCRLAEELDHDKRTLESVAVDMLPKLLTPETIQNAPQTIRVATGMMTRHRPFGLAASSRGMAERPDSTQLLQDLDIPILVLRGSEDVPASREEMEAMATRAKHGRYEEVDGAGHLGPMERPAGYAATILRFLEDPMGNG